VSREDAARERGRGPRTSTRRRAVSLAVAFIIAGGVVAALALPGVRLYWSLRSSNPVRRGVHVARRLGCFSCHGELGSRGLPDPGGPDLTVPSWSGGVWMMYVENEAEIREFILNGVSRRRAASASATSERERMAVRMPAFRDFVTSREVDDLVAAFAALSGMKVPPPGSAADRGRQLARSRRCFSCHGPAGSGGLPNPGSLAGFIPGWYGPDFRDLVRDRDEFDSWVLRGRIPRLEANPVARWFVRRQRLAMPAYRDLSADERSELWAYASWLESETRADSGH
jgi:mono/diheme cytochrome c family protein